MTLIPQPNNVAQRLNQELEKFSFDSGKVGSEDAAVALVVQDTARAEKFITARLWMSEWRIAKSLYEAPVKQEFWRDTQVPRASNSYPLCAQHVRAILDQAMPALVPEWPPFDIEPNPSISREVTRAWELVLGTQLRQVGFVQQLRLIAKDAEIFGTGIGKFGWERFPKKRSFYSRAAQPQRIKNPIEGKPDITVDTVESDELTATDYTNETVSKPFFHRKEVNHVLVAPGLREPDIRKATYVVERDYLTIRDLNKLRDIEGYNIPSEDDLKLLAAPPVEQAGSSAVEAEATSYPAQGHRPLPRYMDESEDPLEHKLEVLERWTNDSCIVVLQRKVTIRNGDNPFGVIPYVSCFWDDIPGTFYGFGIPRRIGSIQTHVQGLRNLRLDDINLNLQNVWLEKRGTNLTGQPLKFYPGARLKVSDPKGIVPMIKQPVLVEAYKEEAALTADAEKTTGANEQTVQGAMPASGRSSMGRSATGAGILGAASSSRVQGFVNVILEQVSMPVLYAFLHMDRELLDPKFIRSIVGKTLWQSLQEQHDGDLLTDMCNSSYDLQFVILAGANIAARQKMAAALPLEMQNISQPAYQQGIAEAGYKTNWLEYGRRMEQATGWKSIEDTIIPLTDEDKQQRAQQNPEVLKSKAALDRIAALHKNNVDLANVKNDHAIQQTDAKGLAGAGEQILVRTLERAAEREEMPEIAGNLEGQVGAGAAATQ